MRLAAGAHQGMHEGQRVGAEPGRGRWSRVSCLSSSSSSRLRRSAGDLGQLLCPGGETHQHRSGRDAAPEEREQAQAHVVGPVHVLEQQHERRRLSGGLEQSRDALEEAAGVRAARARCRTGELGKEPRQLGTPGRLDGAHRPVLAQHPARAQRFGPRPERQDLGTLVAAAQEHANARARALGDELGQQPTLSDPRLTLDDHHATAPGTSVLEPFAEQAHLVDPTDQRRVGGGKAGADRGVGGRPRREPGSRVLVHAR